MMSRFYQRYSKALLVVMFASLAVLHPIAESIPPNNNTETWLAESSTARQTYDEFRYHFGGEELILIGLERDGHTPRFVEALCGRLERLKEIRQVWSPDRLGGVMQGFGLDPQEIARRMQRIALSRDGRLSGIVAVVSDEGLLDRAGTMQQVTGVLNYCQLDTQQIPMTGAPVIVAELNRLGGKESNQTYFLFTLAICLCVLWTILRQLAPAFLILISTIWSFQLTLSIVRLCGGEMNFILDSLPVMIMVFTMAIAIHYVFHCAASQSHPDPIGLALREVRWPCFLAMFTTAIGLASLGMSTIPPIRQFGFATAGGTVIAFIAGLGITPAVMTLYPPTQLRGGSLQSLFGRYSGWLYQRRYRVTALMGGLVVWCAIGMLWIQAEFQPLKFFPADSPVLKNTRFLQEQMASTDSVEIVVDFGTQNRSEVSKVEIVRAFERELLKLDSVPVVLSAATFLPDPLPQGVSLARMASASEGVENDFVAEDGHLWRLSARIESGGRFTQQELFQRISATSTALAKAQGVHVFCTGIAPLIERAQQDIFDGFWKSVLSAFLMISVVMMVCMRSVSAGIVAMIPNIAPLVLVFGTLGWLGIPTDIGTMMTGSIALGIAVDGTLHFLTWYRREFRISQDTVQATRVALEQTGPPILQATLVTGLGMLALAMSNFGPTVRFGLLMATTLGVALIGDLVLLPCLLLLRRGKEHAACSDDHPERLHRPRRPFSLRKSNVRSRTQDRSM